MILGGRFPPWAWLIGLAFAWSVLVLVLACTIHDQGSPTDPDQVFHSYTLVQSDGPAILALVGTPVVISLALAKLLQLKTTRRSGRVNRAAWLLAVLNCMLCLVGLLNVGVVMVPEAIFTICAVATAPLAPNRDDRLARSAARG